MEEKLLVILFLVICALTLIVGFLLGQAMERRRKGAETEYWRKAFNSASRQKQQITKSYLTLIDIITGQVHYEQK